MKDSELSDDEAGDDGCATCFHTGIVTGIEGARACECRRAASRQRFYKRIPTEFGIPTFDTVRPDPKRHANQSDKIAELRRAPDQSYFIYGDNGTGKTYLGWLLAVEAFHAGRHVVTTDLDALLKQYRRWQFVADDPQAVYRSDRPAVLREDLEQKVERYTIFIDEVGGTTVTDYAANEFFHVLKAAASYGHQMILTCDVTPKELIAFWSKKDAHWGRKIGRRIGEYSVGVDLFRKVG